MNNENEVDKKEPEVPASEPEHEGLVSGCDTVSPKESEVPASDSKKSQWKKIFTLSNVCFAIAVVLITIGLFLISNSIHRGAELAKEAYDSVKNKTAEDTYNKFYDTAYASAERKYHVSNNVAIKVASIRDEANLEVLKVSDVEYVIESKDTNENGIDVWMEFYGDGVYTVDMKASEFIIDSDRQYVLVRVPRPELTNCRLTQANQLFWRNGVLNESNSVGTELAIDMRNAGYAKLNNYMKSNVQFYKSAKRTAQVLISDLVKGLNSELTDLVVEVEFVD